MCYKIFLFAVLLVAIPSFAVGQKSLLRETRQSLTGVVSLRVTDTAQQPIETYLLDVGKDRFVELAPTQDWLKLLHQKVVVLGTQRGQTFQVSSVKSLELPKSVKEPQVSLPLGVNDWDIEPEKFQFTNPNLITTPEPTHYTRGVYVVRFRFSDYDVPQKQPSELVNDFFATGYGTFSVKGFFATKIDFFGIDGTVHPEVLTIPFSKAECEAGSKIYNECTEWVKNYLVNTSGVNLTSKTLALVFPGIANTFGPTGTVGPKGDPSYTGTIWMPIDSNSLSIFVMGAAHEIGHNIGCNHPGVLGDDGTFWVSDKADYMSNADAAGPNTYNRLMMGWFKGRLVTISGPTPPGGYWLRLDYRESYRKWPRAVMIEVVDSSGNTSPEYRFIEWSRQIAPYNVFASNYQGYNTGLVVRKGNSNMVPYSNVSMVLDCNHMLPFPLNPPCSAGQSWVEDQYGLRIDFFGTSLAGGLIARVTKTR